VKKWRFSPAIKDKRPVPVSVVARGADGKLVYFREQQKQADSPASSSVTPSDSSKE
jgi:hypothetical protein